MTKFTATFPDGFKATRSSDAAYTHASRREGGRVRFHKSARAARAAAGAYGDVVPTDGYRGEAAPAADPVWRVRFADGTTADMPCADGTNPMVAARDAFPGREFAGASRVRS